MADILLIDDDEELADLLVEYAERFSMLITASQSPVKGLEILRRQTFDAVILDVMLPEMDGFETCRQIRQFSDIPIIMLTARGDVTDRIVGLEIGADDYLPKPFDPRELMARLQANIKRQHKTSAQTTLVFEDIAIEPETQRVLVNDESVSLTTKEYELLILMAGKPGETWSRDSLLAQLTGSELELFSRSIDILVSRLRQKLKPSKPIKTVHGAGYAFVARRLS